MATLDAMGEKERERVTKMAMDSKELEETDFLESKNKTETGSHPMDTMAVDAHDTDNIIIRPAVAEQPQDYDYECPKCLIPCTSFEMFQKHNRLLHKEYQCSRCERLFYGSSLYADHLLECTADNRSQLPNSAKRKQSDPTISKRLRRRSSFFQNGRVSSPPLVRTHSNASSASSFGSVNSGLSHPPRTEKIKKKKFVDMSFSQLALHALLEDKPPNVDRTNKWISQQLDKAPDGDPSEQEATSRLGASSSWAGNFQGTSKDGKPVGFEIVKIKWKQRNPGFSEDFDLE